eukprot:gene4707-5043_t
MASVRFFQLLSLIASLACIFASMPPPFTRELKVTSPYQTGNDVLIAQTLLKRDDAVDKNLVADGIFGSQSATAVMNFQAAVGLKSTGVLDEVSAQKLLDLHSADGYKDSGFTAESMGYLYKFHIPVHKNRSIETDATLFDAKGNVLLKFRVRTHGHRGDGTTQAWPDFGDGDIGLTELASSGNTVTGLVEMDLNSPEPDPDLYGPWPINRIVRGLDGNAALLLPNIRDGILIHTGNWTTSTQVWDESKDMPNSSGCIHGHPTDVENIYNILVGLGVKVNDNTYSGKNYPYKAQGVGVIELID